MMKNIFIQKRSVYLKWLRRVLMKRSCLGWSSIYLSTSCPSWMFKWSSTNWCSLPSFERNSNVVNYSRDFHQYLFLSSSFNVDLFKSSIKFISSSSTFTKIFSQYETNRSELSWSLFYFIFMISNIISFRFLQSTNIGHG